MQPPQQLQDQAQSQAQTAEVLGGVIKAYEDYEHRAPAWQ
jgi:hypothetical protein